MVENRAYLSFGSNIEPETNIKAAIEKLSTRSRLIAISTIWETAPVGFAQQPNFLNGAVIIDTTYAASSLKTQVLEQIEHDLNRVRSSNKNGPRTIDLDIMLFNHDILDFDGRQIPDPDLLKRAFVAIPMAEIAPDYIHPQIGQRLDVIAERFEAEKTQMKKRDIFI